MTESGALGIVRGVFRLRAPGERLVQLHAIELLLISRPGPGRTLLARRTVAVLVRVD